MQRRDCLKGLAALATLGMLPAAVADAGSLRPLGRVRDLRADAWLSSEALMSRLLSASVVIVGERHDNPDHHRLERWLITQLARRGSLGGVAMEMLDDSQQPRLEARSAAEWLTLSDAELRDAVQWNPGWDWQAYGPTLRVVLEQGLVPRAANLNQEAIRDIVAANQAPELPRAVMATQRQALIEGHCNLLPEHMLDGMLAAQVARDRAMAAAVDALPATGLVLCGSGHARRDIGVALHSHREPLSLGLVELPAGQDDWRSVLPDSVDDQPPYDLAWFTLPAARGDRCAELREHFGG